MAAATVFTPTARFWLPIRPLERSNREPVRHQSGAGEAR